MNTMFLVDLSVVSIHLFALSLLFCIDSLRLREGTIKRNPEGYVYLLKTYDGLYKIGRTVDPDNRLRTFSVKLPFPVEYEYLIRCKDRFETERALHQQFSHKRVNGEWFRLDQNDIEQIERSSNGHSKETIQ